VNFKNIKAFTLIELLVVVAIIGILAAVGVVAYNGYTGAAKVSATKTINAQTVKYISAELQKCNLGESSIMNGTRKCAGITAANTIDAAVAILTDMNPYKSADKAVTKAGSNNGDDDVGFIRLTSSGTKDIIIHSCHKTPCGTADNRSIDIIVSIE